MYVCVCVCVCMRACVCVHVYVHVCVGGYVQKNLDRQYLQLPISSISSFLNSSSKSYLKQLVVSLISRAQDQPILFLRFFSQPYPLIVTPPNFSPTFLTPSRPPPPIHFAPSQLYGKYHIIFQKICGIALQQTNTICWNSIVNIIRTEQKNNIKI